MHRAIVMLASIATIELLAQGSASASTWSQLAPIPHLYAIQEAEFGNGGSVSFVAEISVTAAEQPRALPVFVDPLSDALMLGSDEILVKLAAPLPPSLARRLLQVHGAVTVGHRRDSTQYLVRASDPYRAIALAQQLDALPAVEYAHLNFRIALVQDAQITDPLADSQWHLDITRFPAALDRIETLARTSPKIAVLDSGVDLSHQDLVSSYVDPYDALTGTANADANSDSPHGTACAGIIGASMNNGVGVAGLCPGCRIVPIRVVDEASGLTSVSAVVDSLYWAVEHGARVISNSWGLAGSTPPDIANALDAITSAPHDALVLFAAGNDASAVAAGANAAHPSVLAIAATSASDTRAPYSNFGSAVGLAAPAAAVTTDLSGTVGYSSGDYTSSFGGTSAATPVVAGIAGLLLSVAPELTSTQLFQLLQGGAILSGTQSYADGRNDDLGYGRVDADASIAMLLSGEGRPCTSDPSCGREGMCVEGSCRLGCAQGTCAGGLVCADLDTQQVCLAQGAPPTAGAGSGTNAPPGNTTGSSDTPGSDTSPDGSLAPTAGDQPPHAQAQAMDFQGGCTAAPLPGLPLLLLFAAAFLLLRRRPREAPILVALLAFSPGAARAGEKTLLIVLPKDAPKPFKVTFVNAAQANAPRMRIRVVNDGQFRSQAKGALLRATISGGRVRVSADSRSGDPIFDREVALGKRKAKRRRTVAALAKNAVRAIRDAREQASADATPLPVRTAEIAIASMGPVKAVAPEPAAPEPTSSPFDRLGVEHQESVDDTDGRDGPDDDANTFFQIDGGAVSITQNVRTDVEGGRMNLGVAPVPAVVLRAGHRFADRIEFEASTTFTQARFGDAFASRIFGARLQSAATFHVGPAEVGLTLGGRFDQRRSDTKVELLPDTERLSAYLGGLIRFEVAGLRVKLQGAYVPWGQLTERPVSTGSGATVTGYQADVAVAKDLALFGLDTYLVADGSFTALETDFKKVGNRPYRLADGSVGTIGATRVTDRWRRGQLTVGFGLRL